MANSWCKVVDGQIVEGPRAFPNAQAPDATWLPHSLEDPAHTINDKFDGSRFEVRGNAVVEVKLYSPKSAEQIASEVNYIKQRAAANVAMADAKLADETLENRQAWVDFKAAWALLTDVTELSWDYNMPPEPRE